MGCRPGLDPGDRDWREGAACVGARAAAAIHTSPRLTAVIHRHTIGIELSAHLVRPRKVLPHACLLPLRQLLVDQLCARIGGSGWRGHGDGGRLRGRSHCRCPSMAGWGAEVVGAVEAAHPPVRGSPHPLLVVRVDTEVVQLLPQQVRRGEVPGLAGLVAQLQQGQQLGVAWAAGRCSGGGGGKVGGCDGGILVDGGLGWAGRLMGGKRSRERVGLQLARVGDGRGVARSSGVQRQRLSIGAGGRGVEAAHCCWPTLPACRRGRGSGWLWGHRFT
mmetsp:Transcript_29352/g.82781  ORF Transcript_29352/g.82781 Transcript_29352/m.82781 type:complete len:275 (+) Transcript_29352:1311-2135(+)